MIVEKFDTEEQANERNSELNERYGGMWSEGYGSVHEMDGGYVLLPIMTEGPFPVSDSVNTEEISQAEFLALVDG